MPNLHLTELSVRALKATDKQVTYWDTALPGFGVRVGRRAKTWTVLRGRHRERVTIGRYGEKSLSDARKEAHWLLSETNEVLALKPATVDKTVGEARTDFLSDHYEGSTSRWPHLVKLILNRELKSIEHKQLVDIGDDDISRILDKLKTKPSARLHAYRAMRTFFRWCMRPPHRYLRHSPMEGYSPPSRDRKGTRILSDSELVAVWKAADAGTTQIIRLMILWGTRNAESCALQRAWRTADVLTIPGAHTKNGRDHGIPVLPLAADILDGRSGDGEFYFPGRYTNERGINPYSLTELMVRVQKKSVTSGWRLRDLRRTFRSNMARLKVPRDVCEVLINHAPPVLDEIYDRYDRLEEKREALAKYEAFLLALISRD